MMSDLDHSKLLLEIIPRTMGMLRTEIRKVARDEFTTPQYRLLSKITRTVCSNQELADWMGVAPPTMTKMVDKLVERGLVRRSSDKEGKGRNADRRKIAVYPTPRGLARANQVRAAVQQVLARRISKLPSSRKRELLAGLNVLKEFIS